MALLLVPAWVQMGRSSSVAISYSGNRSGWLRRFSYSTPRMKMPQAPLSLAKHSSSRSTSMESRGGMAAHRSRPRPFFQTSASQRL